MEKLKNILKSDTPTTDQPARTSSGKLTGQGSHFPGSDEATTDSAAAATTAGPEHGGSSHIATTTSSATEAQPTTGGVIKDYSVASADFPRAETAQDGSGTAAIGQTGTYSASPLPKGDSTPSTVDPESSNPLTYKKPEAGSHTTAAGVGAGAAATAAGLAFAAGEERQKSEMPGHENPYRASTLDPRVDGLSGATASDTSTTTGSGLASAGAATAYSSRKQEDDVVVPSTLTTAADPTDRSAEYSYSVQEKGLGTSSSTTTEQPSTTTGENEQGMVGKVLGAVGLGSFASAFGVGTTATTTSDDTSAVAETPDQPTTTTGLTSYTAPTQQGPPTTHHRKESIPTTAYPSGTLDSVRAINPPIGGAGSPVVHGDRESHTGRDAAVGTGAGVAAAGAAAVGAHEYEKSKTLREGISGEPQGSAPTLKEAGDTTATSGVDSSTYEESRALRGNISEQPSSGISTAHHATTIGDDTTASQPAVSAIGTERAVEPTTTTAVATPMTATTTEKPVEQDHTARDTAIGAGAGAAAVGAGAYGAHEYSKKDAEKAEAEAAKAEKAAEKEEKQHQKELEKQHKAEEKHHQKELEKDEKHHKKELEKEEKERRKEAEREAEVAALRDQREREKEKALLEKQREEESWERRNSQQRERLTGAAGLVGDEKEKGKEKEKKPSIFKRMFRRRKNKDTGESEDYSTDEEGDKGRNKEAAAAYGSAVVGTGTAGHGAVAHEATTHGTERETAHYPAVDPEEPHNKDAKAAYGAALLGAGVGGVAAAENTSRQPDHPEDTSTLSSYEQASGGATKPSYNPFNKDTPAGTSVADQSGAATTTEGTSRPTEAITGLPYDASKDPAAAQRLSEHHHGSGIGTFDKEDAAVGQGVMERAEAAHPTTGTTTDTVAPATVESTGTHSMQPTGAVTGTPATGVAHTQSTAPGTLDNTGTATAQPAGAVTGLPHSDSGVTSSTSATHDAAGNYVAPTNFTLGEVEKTEPLHHTAAGEGKSGNLPINTDFTLGSVETGKVESGKSSGGIGEKIKEALHIGSKKE